MRQIFEECTHPLRCQGLSAVAIFLDQATLLLQLYERLSTRSLRRVDCTPGRPLQQHQPSSPFPFRALFAPSERGLGNFRESASSSPPPPPPPYLISADEANLNFDFWRNRPNSQRPRSIPAAGISCLYVQVVMCWSIPRREESISSFNRDLALSTGILKRLD